MTQQLNREKLVYRYTSALERGDFDTVEAILLEAEQDSELEQMLMDVMRAYQEEWDQEPIRQTAPSPSKKRRFNAAWMRQNVLRYAAVISLILIVGVGLLTLLGPQIGTVFSGVVSSSGRVNGGPNPEVAAALPTQAALATPLPTMPLPQTEAYYGLEDGEFAYFPTGTPPPLVAEETDESAVIQVTPLAGQPSEEPQLPPADLPTQERLIIKNGEMRLLVEDTDRAVDQVTQIALENGGYVIGSQAWSVDWGKAATVTIAVRAENFETALRRLRDISIDVLNESATGEDVSTEFVDLQSRLRNLGATRDRLRTFLEESQNVDEALRVNQELARIEEEIEVVMGRMQYLQGRAAFSTIRIDLEMPYPTPTITPTPTQTLTPTPTFTPTPWSIQPVIDNAAEAQTRTARGLLGVLTWLVIVPGPYLLLGGLIWLGVRAWMKSRKDEE